MRIQGGKLPGYALVKECLAGNAISHFIVTPIMLYFSYDMFVYFGMKVNAPIPSIWIFLRDFFVCIWANDTLFYWIHRGLHHGSIYKHIHKKHHDFKTSIGIAAEYAHPIEDAFANTLPTIAGNLIMGSHVVVFWAWLCLRIIETVDAHSGYNFSFSPFTLIPFINGADRHDFHHSHNVGSYGSFFCFWDWIMGTDKPYNEYKKAQIRKEFAKVE